MKQWKGIRRKIRAIVADSDEPIEPSTIENALELLALVEARCSPPLKVARGYRPTISFSWDGFEFEVFPSTIEFYKFMDGSTDIHQHLRSPGEPFPPSLITDLESLPTFK
ncbi:hypothetical protein [Mesorhizobium sp. IMUNJ 23232]|uniref:hypothetical protein n=1 Tax=Mesorhizobium sp. IMUNJ 23232 TaxID=3376064 RepID=UPI0037929CF9